MTNPLDNLEALHAAMVQARHVEECHCVNKQSTQFDRDRRYAALRAAEQATDDSSSRSRAGSRRRCC